LKSGTFQYDEVDDGKVITHHGSVVPVLGEANWQLHLPGQVLCLAAATATAQPIHPTVDLVGSPTSYEPGGSATLVWIANYLEYWCEPI
jgi:hypothetical protein